MHNPYGKDYGNAMTVHVSGTSLMLKLDMLMVSSKF